MTILVLVACLSSVLLLRAGQMLLDVGLSRSKNVASAVMRAMCDVAVCILAFWALGGAVLFQSHNGYFSFAPRLIGTSDVTIMLYLPLILIASGHVTGALAERARFGVMAPVSALMAVLIVPTVGHWTWQGFLPRLGAMDLGGALPLHLAGAVVALVLSAGLGARSGKYNHDGSANGIPGHNVALMGVGMMLLFAGWLAYLVYITVLLFGLGGSEQRVMILMFRVILNGLLAGAAGALAAIIYSSFRWGKTEVVLTMMGMVAGLVSTTAGLGTISPWGAVTMGALAGVAGPWLAIWLDTRWHVDEAASMASAVAGGAIISLLGSPLLGPIVGWKPQFAALGANLVGMAATIALAGGLTWLLLQLLKRVMRVRASEADEYDGLDLAEHDINAYPDFHQTMIKSYHTREA